MSIRGFHKGLHRVPLTDEEWRLQERKRQMQMPKGSEAAACNVFACVDDEYERLVRVDGENSAIDLRSRATKPAQSPQRRIPYQGNDR